MFNSKVVYSTLTWTQAQWSCIQEGGNLASVHDVETNNFILSLITTGNNFWLGGYKIVYAWTWTWSDSTDFNYRNWNKGEQHNHLKDCMVLVKDQHGKWNDNPCTDTDVSGFVCRK